MFVSFDRFREELLAAIDHERYEVPPHTVLTGWYCGGHTVTTALSMVRVHYQRRPPHKAADREAEPCS